jgi:two-component system cell cycle response regulator
VSTRRLLVVDDRPTINQVINLALKGHGYEVQSAQTGRDAIVQISIFKPEVVLVDIRLPDMTAFEIKREIDQQAEHSGIKFVLMMVANESFDEAEAQALGFAGRLTKPFDPPYLRQVLNDVLGGASTSVPGSTRQLKTPPPPPGSPQNPSATVDRRSDAKKVPPAAPKKPTPPPFQNPGALRTEGLTIGIPSSAISPPPSRPLPEQGGDDIKKLTESTIRMSGLDDFDWKISDESKKSQDPLWSESPSDSKSISFQPADFPTIELDDSPLEISSPGSRGAAESLSNEFPFDPSQAAFAHSNQQSTSPLSSSSEHTLNSIGSENSAAIEEIIQRQVELRVEELARKILPDIAERVIKSEIRRLLGEVSR